MQPFDLQKAIDGHPLVTRDGQEVTEFHYFSTGKCGHPYLVAAVIKDIGLFTYTQGGKYSMGSECELDLFLAPVKKQAWANVYQYTHNGSYYVGNNYLSEQGALECKDLASNYIKTILLHEWEE